MHFGLTMSPRSTCDMIAISNPADSAQPSGHTFLDLDQLPQISSAVL
jgi:hypothetical protein